MNSPKDILAENDGLAARHAWKRTLKKLKHQKDLIPLEAWERACAQIPDDKRKSETDWFARVHIEKPGYRDKEDVYPTSYFRGFHTEGPKQELKLARAMYLSYDIGFDDSQIEQLAKFPEFPWIRDLHFSCIKPSARSLELVFSRFPKLNRLRLDFIDLSERAQFDALLNAPFVSTLRNLELRWTSMNTRSLEKLLERFEPQQLEGLRLEQERLGSASGQVLARWPGLQYLNCLKISHDSCSDGVLTDEGVQILARSPSRGLISLHLMGEEISDDAAIALGQSSLLNHIQALDLSRNRISDSGLSALLAHPKIESLETLNLNYNRLGDASAKLISAHPGLPRLRTLRVSHNDFSEQGIELLESSRLAQQVDKFRYYS